MEKVLYIEDSVDTAEAVKIILEKAGYNAVIKFDGKSGIKEAKKDKYDAILLDIMLPDMSGWDIFEKLHKLNLKANYAFLSAIPVSVERRKDLNRAGISDYITKPFTKTDLLARIKKMLKKAKKKE